MTRRLIPVLALIVLSTGLSTGCSSLGDLFSSSTSPSATGPVTDGFNGSVVVGGSSFFTFEVGQQGTVSVTLTSLGASGSIGLGIGIANGTTTCQMTNTSPTAAAAASPQISVTENTGSYCVEVFDAGSLTASTTFSVSVTHSQRGRRIRRDRQTGQPRTAAIATDRPLYSRASCARSRRPCRRCSSPSSRSSSTRSASSIR